MRGRLRYCWLGAGSGKGVDDVELDVYRETLDAEKNSRQI